MKKGEGGEKKEKRGKAVISMRSNVNRNGRKFFSQTQQRSYATPVRIFADCACVTGANNSRLILTDITSLINYVGKAK